MRTILVEAFLLSAVACSLSPRAAQTIVTLAGTDKPANNGDRSMPVRNIRDALGLDFASEGSLYVCEVRNPRVWRLPSKGEHTGVAGSGVKGYAGDGGLAKPAQLNEPYEVRFDSHGSMLF